MLIEFRAANHRALLDEQVLTLSASPKADKDLAPSPCTIAVQPTIWRSWIPVVRHDPLLG